MTSLANSDFSTQVESRMIYFWIGAMLGGALAPAAAKDAPGKSTEPRPSQSVV